MFLSNGRVGDFKNHKTNLLQADVKKRVTPITLKNGQIFDTGSQPLILAVIGCRYDSDAFIYAWL
jgi:hypothetical protein